MKPLTLPPILMLSVALPLQAETLLTEDFSGGDGGFTVVNEGGHVDPWAYDSVAETWSTDGSEEGTPSQHTRLTSPELSVVSGGDYVLIFDHRHDIEVGDWDGGAVFLSVNGAAFTYVENSEFTENGYNTGSLIGAHALLGLVAFGGISPGHPAGNYITSMAGPFELNAGDTLQIQFLMANDEFAVGTMTPNWEIDAIRVVSLDDTDGDGMPNFYEEENGLDPNSDDSGDDADMDNVTNITEYENGTDPQDDDTDDDGLTDDVETNSGEWTSATDTGSNPLIPDSDGDGLLDGVENPDLPFMDANQTGSDPNLLDTDGDLIGDGLEVAEGFDPSDPASRPPVPVITILPGLLMGDLTDPEDDGIEGPVDIGPPQTAGMNFDWVSISASQENYFGNFGGSEGAFDIFDNTVGAGQAKWCCGGPPQNATVEFEDPVSITHFTITSGNDVEDRDPRDWQIQGSNDGITFTPIFVQTGDPQLWTARLQTLQVTLPSPSTPYKFIRYEVTRTNNANHQINEIEYFGDLATELFQITSIVTAPDLSVVDLEFTSREGRSYSIERSLGGQVWIELDDGIDGQADITEYTDFAPIPNDGTPVFYRVKQL